MQTISVLDPNFLHRDQVCLDLFKHYTAAWWPFQCLIISMMYGYTRLRLKFIVYKYNHHHHTLTFESQVWRQFQIQAPTFCTNIKCVWTDSSNLPIQCLIIKMLNDKCLDKVGTRIHCLNWSQPTDLRVSEVWTHLAWHIHAFHTIITYRLGSTQLLVALTYA